jgi:hypothetical protein
MKITNTQQASGGNRHLLKALRDIETWMTGMEGNLGIAPTGSQQSTPDQQVAAPAPPMLSVTGANGSYYIQVTHAPQDPDTIYHMQIQYSPTLPFETSKNLTTTEIFGDDVTTTLVLPNTALYFRARTKFNNSPFSAWTNGAGLTFASGAGTSAGVFGFAGAALVALQAGGTKAASAVVVGDVLADLAGLGVTVSAVFSFPAQSNSQVQSTNGGPVALGAQTQIVQGDGNYKNVGDLQLGDSVLVQVGGANIADAINSLVAEPAATLYAFTLNGSQTLRVAGIWCRLKL